jgi:hypothetical protein
VSKHLRRARRGAEPPARGFVGSTPKFFFLHRDRIFGTALYLGGFSAHGFFVDGFLFPVKELGFWTNPVHWVRVLDAAGSYMYFYCKHCNTMNEYRICWFSRFEFPGGKSLCNVCIFHCIFYVLF